MNVLFDSRGSRSFRVLAVASVLGGAPAVAQVPDLFERAVDAVAARHWDREFVQRELPDLVRTFRRAARVARSLAERAVVVDSLLSRVPSSHLALFSRYTFDALMAEVTARPHPTLGLKLEQRGSRFFACEVVAGGPAERAGVRRGDLVVAVDGVPPPRAARLDRHDDDAHLRDPVRRGLRVTAGERVRLVLERTRGRRGEVEIEAQARSTADTVRASVRITARDGLRLGSLHLPFVHDDCAALVAELVRGRLAGCDALVLDLRGRGGSAGEARRLVRMFGGSRRIWRRPLALLIDRSTRSAKELIALELRRRAAALLVGERTAGALVEAGFEDLGDGYVLMVPVGRLRGSSDQVELRGVAPDLSVADSLPFSRGADPIRDAALSWLSSECRARRASGVPRAAASRR